MKRSMLFLSSIFIVLTMLLVAAQPAAAESLQTSNKTGQIDCSKVIISIVNKTGYARMASGWIKLNGIVVASKNSSGPVWEDSSFTVEWIPPANTVGDVEAYVELRSTMGSVKDSHSIKGSLFCAQHVPVTLCHATASQTNPFNLITVDDDAVFKQGHDQHQNNGDIIPSFTYWDKNGQHTYPGQNLTMLYGWGATGAEVLAAGCVIPPPPHSYTVEIKDIKENCSGWERYYRIFDNGSPVTMWITVDSGPWSNIWILESTPAKSYTITLPDQTTKTLNFPEITEAGRCQATHSVEYGIGGDCDKWEAWYSIDKGNKVVYSSGNWTLPFKLEDVTVPAYSFPKNPGELYNLSEIPSQGLKESEKCQLIHKVTWRIESDCERWVAYYSIDGVETAYDKGIWTKPFVLEEATAASINIPLNDGELYDNKIVPAQSVNEPEKCQVAHKVTSGVEQDCKGWYAWFAVDGEVKQYASGTWGDIYKLEEASVAEVLIPTVPGEIYDKTKIDAFTVKEEKSCLVVLEHQINPLVDKDCNGWSIGLEASEGGIVTATTPTSGNWIDPFVTEGAEASFHVIWPDGFEKDFTFNIKEDEVCLKDHPLVKITVQACAFNMKERISHSLVTIEVKGAILELEGETYGPGTYEVDFKAGKYSGTYKAIEGFLGDGEISFEVGSCYVKRPKPQCPTCGPRQEELAKEPDDLVTVEYARGECMVCLDGYWGIKTEGTSLYMRSIHPFYILVSVDPKVLDEAGVEYRLVEVGKHKIKQVYIDAKPFEGFDGTYYIIDLEKKYTHDNWVAFDASGELYEKVWGYSSSWRSWYVSCSRTVGGWDITKAGEFTRQFQGPNGYDYVMYLVENKYMSYEEAQKWVAEYWKIDSGIMLLPPKK